MEGLPRAELYWVWVGNGLEGRQLYLGLFSLPLQIYSACFSGTCSLSQEANFYGCMTQVTSPVGCPSRRSERLERVRSGLVSHSWRMVAAPCREAWLHLTSFSTFRWLCSLPPHCWGLRVVTAWLLWAPESCTTSMAFLHPHCYIFKKKSSQMVPFWMGHLLPIGC